MLKRLIIAVVLIGSVVSVYAEEATGPAVSFYGLAQYRLRDRIYSQSFKAGDSTYSRNVYTNQIGYYAGLKAKVNDQVSLQFQIGNDWVNTETITLLSSNHYGLKSGTYPFFHLAYAKWDPGVVNVSVGIIPEAAYGALDLIERSLATGTYGSAQGYGAGQVGWITGANNSITGAKVGVPLLKSTVKLSAEFLAAIVDSAAHAATVAKDPKSYPSRQLYVLDFPVSYKNLTAGVQVAAVLFREYNQVTEKGDNEFSAGFSGSYKVSPKLSVRANAGFASFSNKNSHTGNTTADSIEFSRVGTLAGVGGTYKAGPGNVLVDLNYSSDENTKTTLDSKYGFLYSDIKYVWSANKNFEITPRLRIFSTNYPDGSATIKSKTEYRPELLLTGKF